MKNLILLFLAVFILSSCEKRNCGCHRHKPKACPTVNSESVPSTVKESFATRYQNTSNEQWYDKGSKGYAVIFTKCSKKNLAEFNKSGNFIAEQTENSCHNKYDDDDDERCGDKKDKEECSCSLSGDDD